MKYLMLCSNKENNHLVVLDKILHFSLNISGVAWVSAAHGASKFRPSLKIIDFSGFVDFIYVLMHHIFGANILSSFTNIDITYIETVFTKLNEKSTINFQLELELEYCYFK